jgi:endo-1,4-beta-xylanase
MRILAVLGTIAALGLAMSSEPVPALHAAFADRFAIGMGLSARDAADPAVLDLAARHAVVVTAENEMKPAAFVRDDGRLDTAQADAFVAIAARRNLAVHGHTLLWHSSAPAWFFAAPPGAGKAPTRERLDAYCRAVVGRYAGRIGSWDVANEVLLDGPGDGLLRDSPWTAAGGLDCLVTAFTAAAAADPAATLIYNDYEIESEPKRGRALRLVAALRAAGCRVDGIGIQGHWTLDHPRIAVIDAAIAAFAAAGLQVHISELDVTVLPRSFTGADVQRTAINSGDPYRTGLPTKMQQRLAAHYAELFRCFLRHPGVVRRVTFWNVHDGRSWLNDWPTQGRTDHPLLFDRAMQPKPAFFAVVGTTRPTP